MAYLTDPNSEPVIRQMTVLQGDSLSLEPGRWYRTTFQLQLSEAKEISSTLTIQEKDGQDPLYTATAVYAPSELEENGIVRMIISGTDGTDLLIGDFKLSSE